MAKILDLKEDLAKGMILRRKSWKEPRHFIWDRGDGLIVRATFGRHCGMTGHLFSIDQMEADDWESYSVPMVEEKRRLITVRKPSDDFMREFDTPLKKVCDLASGAIEKQREKMGLPPPRKRPQPSRDLLQESNDARESERCMHPTLPR